MPTRSEDLTASIRGLGKAYEITRSVHRHSRMVDLLAQRLRHPFGSQAQDVFWALRDVSFDVYKGEVVGLVGHNGAGKSTLLKILSRITAPTLGEADLNGRVGCLLEVGTGFHPELSGRENIYLNGTILGMTRRQIARRFDEIVEFSGVERFLDTPVKRYSSGMSVRLAFAVAAHLDSEILIVDEVLAVGDAEFQRRCLGKMQGVAQSGRTVLFVSHNLATVQSLCTRALVLADGRCIFDGAVCEAVGVYLAGMQVASARVELSAVSPRGGSGVARFTGLAFQDESGEPTSIVAMGRALNLALRFTCSEAVSHINFVVGVVDQSGQPIFRVQANEVGDLPSCRRGGEVQCRIPEVMLVPGVYYVTLGMNQANGDLLDHLSHVASFHVVEADVFGTGRFPDRMTGAVFARSEWSFDCS
ncbi:MAG: ABC transporter ATP-binding protein [Isosphaeraceae bacterium]|nr:ABC transporter ATP-binding protein [Isosphaeraceae bacterium]